MGRYISATDIALIIVFSVKWTDFFRYHVSLNQPVFSLYTAHVVPNDYTAQYTSNYGMLQHVYIFCHESFFA